MTPAPYPILIEVPLGVADVVHSVCCEDNDLALCGTDVAGQPWVQRGTDCVVCIDLDALSVCPLFEVCPVVGSLR